MANKNDKFDYNGVLKFITSCKYLDDFELRDLIINTIKNNPYESESAFKSSMWNEQCVLNFPILYLSCIYIYLLSKKLGRNILLFASRDCCHLVKVYKKLFKGFDQRVHYF